MAWVITSLSRGRSVRLCKMHTLILGAGFSGMRIAAKAQMLGSVCGTRRGQSGIEELAALNIPGIMVEGSPLAQPRKPGDEFAAHLAQATHLYISVAPARQPPLDDPMLNLLKPLTRKQLPRLEWIGYLSTIGVYGDHDGRWVDEQTPCTSHQPRSIVRREAEVAWQSWAESLSLPIALIRLSGIYGPGRNAVVDALAGRARMLIKPGQVFNRIHVEDLATAAIKAGQLRFNGILNITDDLPAPPQDVIRYAHELVGKSAPEAQDFASAEISPMARSFYSENKRVRNSLSKSSLGFDYAYPDYRAGLAIVWDQLKET